MICIRRRVDVTKITFHVSSLLVVDFTLMEIVAILLFQSVKFTSRISKSSKLYCTNKLIKCILFFIFLFLGLKISEEKFIIKIHFIFEILLVSSCILIIFNIYYILYTFCINYIFNLQKCFEKKCILKNKFLFY